MAPPLPSTAEHRSNIDEYTVTLALTVLFLLNSMAPPLSLS